LLEDGRSHDQPYAKCSGLQNQSSLTVGKREALWVVAQQIAEEIDRQD
jgi:hypothetical protein